MSKINADSIQLASTLISDSGALAQSLGTACSGILGGSYVLVDPAHPDAIDNADKRTPFVTIQSAINACDDHGIVFIASNGTIPYVENLTLNRNVKLQGFSSSYLITAGYAYVEGIVSIPNTAVGSQFEFSGLYLENNNNNAANFTFQRSGSIGLYNCAVYNFHIGLSAHIITLGASASTLNVYVDKLEVGAEGTNKFIHHSLPAQYVDIQGNHLIVPTTNPTDLCYVIELRDSRLGSINFMANEGGGSEFINCQFGGPLNKTTSADLFLDRCNFAGESYADYVVSAVPSTVYVNNLSFMNKDVSAGGYPKTVSGATEFRLDGLNNEVLLAHVEGIDGLANSDPTLFTTPNIAGYRCYITRVTLRITSAVGLTGQLTAGVGNNLFEDDIFMDRALTSFSAVNDAYSFLPSGGFKSMGQNQLVKLGIDTPFGGTTVTLSADVFGYYERV